MVVTKPTLLSGLTKGMPKAAVKSFKLRTASRMSLAKMPIKICIRNGH